MCGFVPCNNAVDYLLPFRNRSFDHKQNLISRKQNPISIRFQFDIFWKLTTWNGPQTTWRSFTPIDLNGVNVERLLTNLWLIVWPLSTGIPCLNNSQPRWKQNRWHIFLQMVHKTSWNNHVKSLVKFCVCKKGSINVGDNSVFSMKKKMELNQRCRLRSLPPLPVNLSILLRLPHQASISIDRHTRGATLVLWSNVILMLEAMMLNWVNIFDRHGAPHQITFSSQKMGDNRKFAENMTNKKRMENNAPNGKKKF